MLTAAIQLSSCPICSPKLSYRDGTRLSRASAQSHQRATCIIRPTSAKRAQLIQLRAYKVEIEHENGTTILDVEEGTTILDAALETGLELSHDCKMGVCMTCPARLVSGQIDQTAGMLDQEVKDKGYALLCVAEPRSDCVIRIIEEDELLAEVLQGG